MTAAGFDLEGRTIATRPGDTLASAMARAGVLSQRISRHGTQRGYFCGIGVCHDCLVEVDGRGAQRACLTVADGVRSVRRHGDGAAAPLAPLALQPDAVPPCARADIAIVGAGPAGLAAALAASGHGQRILLVDERPRAGGQYYKPAHRGRDPIRHDRQHREGIALRERLAAAAVAHWAHHTVVLAARCDEGFELSLIGEGRARLLRTRALILATGAYERPPLVPGWTLPGVMTVGAAQALVRSHGTLPGRRVVIAGEGPLSLQLADELARAGQPATVLAERARPFSVTRLGAAARAFGAAPDMVADGLRQRRRVRRAGTRILEGVQLVGCDGEDRVQAAWLARAAGGEAQRYAADVVCVGEGFLPQTELARLLGCEATLDPHHGFPVPTRDGSGATTARGLWIAGDAGGLGGARVAAAQGEIAAVQALRFVSSRTGPSPETARRRLARAERFQRALWTLYAAQPRAAPSDETVLCRCEEVSVGDARTAIANGARDLGALKRMTRLGMGRCQGRYCAGAAAQLVEATEPFVPQAPSRPAPIAALAFEKPEWVGHRQTPAPRLQPAGPRPDGAEPLPSRADLVIIGGGIMGVAAALRAAELGLEPVVLERGAVNSGSSGGNAGSLHLQLLSFDFGEKTGGRSDALLQTLPLQRDAISLWHDLEGRADTTFEIALTGGLMVAESDADVEFLSAKVAAEKSVGVDVELIDRNEIARVAPAVSERMVAGAWCAGEGKINPLVATPSLARLAARHGARFREGVEVTAIVQERAGYRLATNAGDVTADRLILAAGGWTGRLTAMLGVPLPIHGAPLQMIVTECAPELAPCLLAHAGRRLTMKQAAAGNLILGGAWSAATDPDSGRARILRESLEGNLWVGTRVVPALAGLHVLRAWGAMNVDIDGAPLVGPLPGHPNCTVAAGANGYTLGPLLGAVAAESAANGAMPAGMRRFTPERFQTKKRAA